MASTASIAFTTPSVNPADLLAAKAPAKPTATSQTKTKAAAEDFEAVFLNSMFQHMFTGLGGEGPMGGKGATGVWRSFLTDQYAKNIAKAGGIGIADQVYRSLLAQQEARS
jgi:Rod binding domain-containing protein